MATPTYTDGVKEGLNIALECAKAELKKAKDELALAEKTTKILRLARLSAPASDTRQPIALQQRSEKRFEIDTNAGACR